MTSRVVRAAAAAVAMLGYACERGPSPVGDFAASSPGGPRVVARVDAAPLYLWELAREWRRVPPPADASADARVVHARRLLDGLVEHAVLVAEARRRGLWPTAAVLDAAYVARAADYPDEHAFVEALVAEGHTIERYREQLAEHLAVERLLAEARNGERSSAAPAAAPEAVAAYYEAHLEEFAAPDEMRALHVVAATAEEAKLARDDVAHGADFGAVARARSIGPEAAGGGDLGYFAKGVMPEGFDRAFDFAPGQVSPVIETDTGFHIFKVVDKRPAHVRPLAEVEEAILRVLEAPRDADAERAYVARVRDAATIEVDEAALRELR